MEKNDKTNKKFHLMACVISLIAIWIIINIPQNLLLDICFLRPQDLLVLHLLLEGFSVTVCLFVVSTAILVRDQARLSSATLLTFGFSLVAGLDILHVINLEGMPGLFTEASTSKAIFFWLSARVVGVATIFFVGINFRFIRGPKIGVASAMFVGTIILYIGTYHIDSIPALFINNAGVTALKVRIEYLIIGTYFICTFLFYSRWRRDGKSKDIKISTACFILGVGEFAFTGYLAPTDTVVIFGHLFKVAAYALLFSGIYVSRAPRKTTPVLA